MFLEEKNGPREISVKRMVNQQNVGIDHNDNEHSNEKGSLELWIDPIHRPINYRPIILSTFLVLSGFFLFPNRSNQTNFSPFGHFYTKVFY